MKRPTFKSTVFLAALTVFFLSAASSNMLAVNDVNFADYSILANDWWRCVEPNDPSCEKPWLEESEYTPESSDCYSNYNVINIDLNGGPNDPCYVGTAAFAQAQGTDCVIGEWTGYYQGEGELMDSPRCANIGIPGSPATYARAVFVVDPCTHGYVSSEPNLLGDGFVKTGGGLDPSLFMYGNWAYGGIFDIYVLASAPGSFTLRDGKGTIHGPNSLAGDSNESNWVEGQNYVKFTDVWIGGTNTRDANGPMADYLNNDEYLTDSNCAILKYTNQINGIQLASVKRKVRAAGPADPCVCYWDNTSQTRKKISQGQWTQDTPIAAVKSAGASSSRLFFCADYDAYYETNARMGEYDYDGPDAGWAMQNRNSLIDYVDENWAKDGYCSYVDTGEWMEYDIIVTSQTASEYTVRALVNCWWGAADIGIYIDDSSELGSLEHEKFEETSPPITDSNVIVWTENSVKIMLISGLHKLRCKQNRAYYDILGFEIRCNYIPPWPDCNGVIKYGLGLAGDLNEDCYVDYEDLALFMDTWLQPEP